MAKIREERKPPTKTKKYFYYHEQDRKVAGIYENI
jgi:hypothetical protein